MMNGNYIATPNQLGLMPWGNGGKLVGKAAAKVVRKAATACAKPFRKEHTRRVGGHHVAGAAACILGTNVRNF